ncbi:unnamed protein product [Amoebophrya sp. A25]|nr:unnamed protein product [Amoebophrya sp. A25]|eukprot:GSA25T00018931001.1
MLFTEIGGALAEPPVVNEEKGGPADSTVRNLALLPIIPRQKLSHVRWQEMTVLHSEKLLPTLNVREMFGELDAATIFPSSFYAFDLWSWTRNIAAVLDAARDEADDVKREEQQQHQSSVRKTSSAAAENASRSRTTTSTTSTNKASAASSSSSSGWTDFFPLRWLDPEYTEESDQYRRSLKVTLALPPESLAQMVKDGKSKKNIAESVLGTIARQMNFNLDPQAEQYPLVFDVYGQEMQMGQKHAGKKMKNKEVDLPKDESSALVYEEVLDVSKILDQTNSRTTSRSGEERAVTPQLFNQDWSMGEIAVGLWAHETFVRTEGDAALPFLLYLRYLLLFLTQANYSERECRREVGVAGHLTWLLFWVYTREHEKHQVVAADEDDNLLDHEPARSTTSSSNRSAYEQDKAQPEPPFEQDKWGSTNGIPTNKPPIKGTIFRLLQVARDPALGYLKAIFEFLQHSRCQSQYIADEDYQRWVDGRQKIHHSSRKAFGNRVAREYFEQMKDHFTSMTDNLVVHADEISSGASSSPSSSASSRSFTSPSSFKNLKTSFICNGRNGEVGDRRPSTASSRRDSSNKSWLDTWDPTEAPKFEVYDQQQEMCDHGGTFLNGTLVSVPVRPRNERIFFDLKSDEAVAWRWCRNEGSEVESSSGGTEPLDLMLGCEELIRFNREFQHDVGAVEDDDDKEEEVRHNRDWMQFLLQMQQVIRWEQYARWSYQWL